MSSFDLSYLLRHGAIRERLSIRSDGYVPMTEILGYYKFRQCSIDDVKRIIDADKKGRFSIIQDSKGYWVRANQGHSHEVASRILEESLLRKIHSPIDGCFHGTYAHVIASIQRDGLRTMNRKHIHFASSKSAKSGSRRDCDALVYIDMEKAMRDGIQFYESDNGVILTSGKDGVLEPQYFKRVEYL